MRLSLCLLGLTRRAMRAGCVLAALLLVASVPAYAQETVEKEGETAAHYVVEKGDTLYGIARAHGLDVARLRRLNGLEGSAIYPGQQLRVRPAPDETAPPPDSARQRVPERAEASRPGAAGEARRHAGSTAPLYGAHRVRREAATLYRIAARYGASVDSLVALNDSLLAAGAATLRPGQTVRLPPSLGPPTHTVAEGETIYDVARQYSVSAKLLQHTNGLDEKAVRAGQRLRIPGRKAPQPQPPGTRPPVSERGPVARYPASYEGRLMAGGARYDPAQYVASHPSLPLGTVVLLTNPANGRQAFAHVADRGPLDEAFIMDVSDAVHERLGLGDAESDRPVTVRVMD